MAPETGLDSMRSLPFCSYQYKGRHHPEESQETVQENKDSRSSSKPVSGGLPSDHTPQGGLQTALGARDRGLGQLD